MFFSGPSQKQSTCNVSGGEEDAIDRRILKDEGYASTVV